MPREVRINPIVNSSKAVSGIRELKKAFQELNEELKKNTKDGSLKIKVDLEGIDMNMFKNLSNGFSKLGKGMELFNKNIDEVSKNGKLLNITTNNITNNVTKGVSGLKNYTDGLGRLARSQDEVTVRMAAMISVFQLTQNTFKRTFSDYSALTQATYNVGIAGQMNLKQIDALNESFLTLSTTVPKTALELANAVDGLIRTGRSYEDASKIIKEVAVLSVASGDDLKSTAEVVTKVMVSLGVSGDRVKETLSTLHSVAIQTASDMNYLSGAFKSVAGTSSVLVNSSGKVGTQLDGYRQSVLDLNMAMIGALANMGVSASEAGTKVKNLMSRLLSAEKVAKTMFNETMKFNNVQFEGKLFDYSALSKLAKTDLNKAIELLSQLRKQGILTDEVMTKLFTQRHGMDIAALLEQVNGNVDLFVEKLAKGVDYIEDAKKKMFDINEQWKLFGNLSQSIGQKLGVTGLGSGLTALLMLINEGLKGFDNFITKGKNLNQTMSVLGTIVSSVGTGFISTLALVGSLTVAIAGLKAGLVALSVALGASFAPVLLVGTALTGIITLVAKLKADGEKAFLDNGQLVSEFSKSLRYVGDDLDRISSKINRVSDTLNNVDGSSLNMELNRTSLILDAILGKFSGIQKYLSAFGNVDVIGIDEINEAKKAVESLSESVKEQQTKLAAIKAKREQQVQKFLIPKDKEWMHESFKEINAVYKKYFDDILTMTPDKAFESAVYFGRKKFATDYSGNLGNLIANAGKDGRLKEIQELNKELQKSQGLIKEFDDKLNQATGNVTKKRQEEANSLAQMSAFLSDLKAENFLKDGTIELDGKVFKGMGAVTELAVQSAIENHANNLNKTKNKLLDAEAEQLNLLNKNSKELTNEERNRLKELPDIIKNRKIELEILEKSTDEIAKQARLSAITALTPFNNLKDINPEILSKLMGKVQNQLFIDTAKKDGISNDIVKTAVETNREIDKSINNAIVKTQKKKDSNTKYQLKHISLLREELQLELERAKIGASLEQQAYLEYEYKLKTLQANKDIAQDEKESVYKLVKSYSAESKEGASYLAKALKANSAKEIVGLLNDFESKYSGIMTGENGRKVKSDYDEIVKLLNALKGVEKAGENFKIEILKGINAVQNTMVSSIYKELSTNNPKYTQQYTSNLLKEFENQKKKIGKDFGLGDSFNLRNELERSGAKLDLLKAIGADPNKLKDFKDEVVEIFGEDTYNDMSKSQENMALVMSKVTNENKALLDLEKKRLDYNQEITKSLTKQADALGSIAGLFNNMGNVFKSEFFTNIGGTINSIKDMQKHLKDPNNKFDLSSVFSTDKFIDKLGNVNWDSYFDNFSKAFENMNKSMMQGSSIGTLVGSITGGGASSQAAGGLAGLITGAMSNLNPFASMGIQFGASLLGGLFDRSGKDQAKAEKRTREANKIYNANTEALQKLSQNMSSLSGGVEGLNNSLISSFSKIPTVGNLNNVTDAMTSLYKTMDKTRIFNDVAYQVTKTKKKKGFLGIGGSSTSWTETYELSVQDMLNKYGFKGTITDMSTKQLREFSKWLKDYDMGESDNFSILADAVSEYAEALDKMDKNISKFFYDATMEGFEGISSIQQEELRQQIEDFYKNLGLTIDEETSKQIDQLAEQMSVMVSIMGDVRNNFLNTWRESGVSAGKAFLSSMQPYIQAMLSNISQIYYDVYFSDVNKQLEDTFKQLSEQLVELKKQGSSLNWSNVANELSGSFGKVLDTIKATKYETTSFNDIMLQLQKQALESGLSLSEIFDLGLATGTQKTVLDSFKTALTSGEADGAFVSIGKSVGETIGDALVNQLIDSMMSDKILEMSAQLDKVVSGNLNVDSLTGLANDAMSVGLMLEQQRLRFDALLDMFNWDADITYENQDNKIQYETGVSSQQVYNYYLSSNIDAGNVIEADSVERLADSLLDMMIEKLRNEKGIDLTK